MKYKHVLAATDFSSLGDLALSRGAQLAADSGAKLTVVHVLPEPDAPSPLFAHYEVTRDAGKLEAAKQGAAAALEERIPADVKNADVEIDYRVVLGDPATEILTLDVRLAPDLIVLATHGRRGWQRWIMGSVAERVVQMARADVLAVRERDPVDLDEL